MANVVHSASRHKISLTSSSDLPKNSNFSLTDQKNYCAAEMKITKLYACHFTSGRDGGRLAATLYKKKKKKKKKNTKQMVTILDRSEGIVKVSA